jgi:hypothetical protein
MAKFGHAFRLDTGHPSGIKEKIYAAAVERKEKRDQPGTFFWEARIVGGKVDAKRVVRYLLERPVLKPTHGFMTESHRVKLSCGWEQVEAFTVETIFKREHFNDHFVPRSGYVLHFMKQSTTDTAHFYEQQGR